MGTTDIDAQPFIVGCSFFLRALMANAVLQNYSMGNRECRKAKRKKIVQFRPSSMLLSDVINTKEKRGL